MVPSCVRPLVSHPYAKAFRGLDGKVIESARLRNCNNGAITRLDLNVGNASLAKIHGRCRPLLKPLTCTTLIDESYDTRLAAVRLSGITLSLRFQECRIA